MKLYILASFCAVLASMIVGLLAVNGAADNECNDGFYEKQFSSRTVADLLNLYNLTGACQEICNGFCTSRQGALTDKIDPTDVVWGCQQSDFSFAVTAATCTCYECVPDLCSDGFIENDFNSATVARLRDRYNIQGPCEATCKGWCTNPNGGLFGGVNATAVVSECEPDEFSTDPDRVKCKCIQCVKDPNA